MDPDLDDDDEKQTPLLQGAECQCKGAKSPASPLVTCRGYLGRRCCVMLLGLLVCTVLSFAVTWPDWKTTVCGSQEQIELRIIERQREIAHSLSAELISTIRAEVESSRMLLQLMLDDGMGRIFDILKESIPRPYDMYDHGAMYLYDDHNAMPPVD